MDPNFAADAFEFGLGITVEYRIPSRIRIPAFHLAPRLSVCSDLIYSYTLSSGKMGGCSSQCPLDLVMVGNSGNVAVNVTQVSLVSFCGTLLSNWRLLLRSRCCVTFFNEERQ